MSNKAAPKHTRRRSTAKVPPGLEYAFKLIDIDGGSTFASQVQLHAEKIIRNIHEQSDGPRLDMELMAAARSLFPPYANDPTTDPENSPELAASAGFYVGYAACWLLITRINGGAR